MLVVTGVTSGRSLVLAALLAAAATTSACASNAPHGASGAGPSDGPVATATSTPDLPVFPDADTTGVADRESLTPSDSLTVTEDGAVVEGLHVMGRILVEASDVTIRNTLVEADTDLYAIHVTKSAGGVLITNVEVDNQDGVGIGIFLQARGVVRNADIHSVGDGIRIQADAVEIVDSYVHDLNRQPGGHHDCIQIRSGDDVVVKGNNLQAYVPSTDDPMNAAIQIGSLSGDDQISDLLVIGNLMNGGNYTINGGGRNEVDSATYADNRFGRDFRFGVQGNLENSNWEDTNVWHSTGESVE